MNNKSLLLLIAVCGLSVTGCSPDVQEFTRERSNGAIDKGYAYQKRDGSWVLHGEYTSIETNGLKHTRTYSHGKTIGKIVTWYPNGNRAIEHDPDDDNARMNGEWTCWYPDGQLQSEEHFIHGNLYGHFRHWSTNGTLIAEGEYKAWKYANLTGKDWLPTYVPGCDGTDEWEGSFLSSIKDGHDGKVFQFIHHYREGKLILSTDMNGIPLDGTYIINNETSVYASGTLESGPAW